MYYEIILLRLGMTNLQQQIQIFKKMVREFIIDGKEKWNQYVQENPFGTLLNTSYWGSFQSELDKKVFRLRLEDNGSGLEGLSLIIKEELPPAKSYFYAPRGPLLKYLQNNFEEDLKKFIKAVKNIAEEEDAIFLRIDPSLPESFLETFLKLGFKRADKEVQPRETLLLDITRSPEEILAKMKPKTRYNIRLSDKKGIKIKTSQNSKDIRHFTDLIEVAEKRGNFRYHSKKHYSKFLEVLGKENLALLFWAEYGQKTLAAIIITFWQGRATYAHGVSGEDYKNLMAPYLLQWQAIKEAKKRGCNFYDFHGITASTDPNHPWTGITRFKKGFAPNGKIERYMGSMDFVFQPEWYKLFNFVRKIRKFL